MIDATTQAAQAINQSLAIAAIVSGGVACFAAGIAVALWNIRGKADLVPVIVERVERIEDKLGTELERMRDSIDKLTATIERRAPGDTLFRSN